jgi:hypothetical protein
MNIGSVDFQLKRGQTCANIPRAEYGLIRLDDDDGLGDAYDSDPHSRSVLIHQQTRQAIEDLCRMS